MANRRFIDFPIASTVGDNDIVLIWQDGLNKQTTKGTLIQGAPTSLEGLTDVDIAGLINGQILQYNSVTGKWENVDRTGLNLSELGDVSIVSPSNGQVLVYNSTTNKWENSSAGFVPYVGAVTTVDLGAQGLRAGYVRFNTSVVSVPNEQGLMYWDGDDETIAVILNGYIMKIGEDQFYPVKNQTGSSIAKGTAVRFAGTVGASGRLLIAPFIADGSVPSSFFMGVTAEAIADGADGKVLFFGRIRGINTNAFNEGDVLYASTTVAGGFQTAVPLAPNNIVQVAAVINKSINQGVIFIRPSFGSNINQDEGVKIVSPTTGQLLQLQANGLWENKTTAQVLGGTSTQFVKGDGTLDSNTYQVTSEKGQPNGYASLDSNGKVPLVQINDALIGNVNFQGLWNASTNTPTLANPPASGTKGYYYIVSTAGTFASISFEVGDWIISDGTAWGKVDNTDAVSSVFGRTGNVTAANGDYTTAQVTESGNLYFTNARAIASVLTGYSSGSGTISAADSILSAIQKLNGNIGALVTGVSSVNGQTGVVVLTTTNIAEGTNLYYTEARVNANTNVAANTAARHAAVTLGTANGLSLSTQQLSLGLASAGVTGALSGTDWSTFNSKQNALTNPVTGTGTAGQVAFWNGTTTQTGDNGLFWNNTNKRLGIGTSSPIYKLNVHETSDTDVRIQLTNGGTGTGVGDGFHIIANGSSQNFQVNLLQRENGAIGFWTSNIQRMLIASTGNLLLNTTTDAGFRLDVNGTARVQGAVTLTGALNGTSATFTSAVGTGQLTTTLTNGLVLIRDNGTAQVEVNIRHTTKNAVLSFTQDAVADRWAIGTKPNDGILYFSSNFDLSTPKLTLSSAGAATFSSSVTATSFIRSGGTSAQFLKADGSIDSNTYYLASNPSAFIALTALSGTAPIEYNNTTGAISITQASGSTNGFLSSTDWNTFNNKTSNVGTVTSVAALTLGTSGTDLSSSVANSTTTPVITLNVPTASAANRGALSAADWTTFNSKENAIVAGTTAQYYRGDKTFQTLNTAAVPELTNLYYTEARVNANANVAANTAARHNAVTLGTANGLSLSTQQLSLGLASSSANGALSSTDWTTFNNKQNALTNPVTGTGTTNTLPKFTGTSTIGNSILSESGSIISVIANSASLRVTETGGADLRMVAGGSSGFFGTYSNHSLQFLTNSGTKATLDSSGNLGLGVTPSAWNSAYSIMQIGSGGSIVGYKTGNANELFIGANVFENTTGTWTYIQSASTSQYLQINGSHIWRNAPSGTAGNAISFTQAMTLGSNSGLSIGTPSAAPAQGLLVQGAANFNSSVTASYYDGAIFRVFTSSTFRGGVGTGSWAFADGSTNMALTSEAATLIGAGGFERMRIFSDGNVGINTGATNAGFKLDVNGTGRFTSNLLAQKVQVGTAATINDATGVGNTLQFANYSAGVFVTGSADSYIYKTSSVFGGLAAQTLIFQTRSDVAGGGFAFVGGSTPSVIAKIDQTGVATFSSSVTATRYLVTPSGTNAVYNFVDSNSSYAGSYNLQAGGGSAGFGGSLVMYGHSHASRAGFVSAGISTGSNGRFTVMNGGNGSGSDVFTVDVNGAGIFSSSVTATQFNVGTGTINFSSGDALLDYSSASVRLRTFSPGVGYITPLTIAASTGAATFSSSVTATSIIRSGGTSSQYLMADGSVSTLTNPVTGTGSGTTNTIPKFTGANALGNSIITDSGSLVSIDGNFRIRNSNGFNDSVNFDRTAINGLILNSSGNLILNGSTGSSRITCYGDGYFSGGVQTGLTTGASSSSIWLLGEARGGTVTTNATVRVEIGGVLVDLVARYV
jgi:hypothetical protein